jgi:ribosomal protein S27E
MQIKVVTPYGENRFDMGAKHVADIIKHCFDFSNEQSLDPGELDSYKPPVPDGEPYYEQEFDELPDPEEKQDVVPEEKKERHTRVESLFGPDWRSRPEKTADEVQRDFAHEMNGYKGFLYVKCPDCGEIKGTCLKQERKSITCDCGTEIPLKDLKPMYAKCECGKEFRYFTNLEDETFEYTCINCGAQVDMTINSRRSAYVTVGKNRFGGGGTNRNRYGFALGGY